MQTSISAGIVVFFVTIKTLTKKNNRKAIPHEKISDDFLFPESSCFQLKLHLVSITCLHLLFMRHLRTKHEIFLRKTKFQQQLCLYEVSEMKLSNNERFATFYLLHRIQMIAITTKSSIRVKLPAIFLCAGKVLKRFPIFTFSRISLFYSVFKSQKCAG